jgi:hypothetical protein
VIFGTADQPAIRVSASITGLFDVQGYRLGLKRQKRDRKTATVLLGEGLCCDRHAIRSRKHGPGLGVAPLTLQTLYWLPSGNSTT